MKTEIKTADPAIVEQPAPVAGGVDIAELVKRDIDARMQLGVLRYGQRLQSFNGRDALVDAYQESCDQTLYLRQKLTELGYEDLEQRKPSGNPSKSTAGVGMPASLYLQEFGDTIFRAFGEVPYHVGSSLTGSVWRDVDVRLMLSAEQYQTLQLGDPLNPHGNARWRLFTQAFSLLGRAMTGLPIDFQIQEAGRANADYPGRRSALFVVSVPAKEADKPA